MTPKPITTSELQAADTSLCALIAAGMPINGVRQFDEATSARMLDAYGFGTQPEAATKLLVDLQQCATDEERDCVTWRHSIRQLLDDVPMSPADLRFIYVLVGQLSSSHPGVLYEQLRAIADEAPPAGLSPAPATGHPA